jgi:WD40 repeat protein/serine/threonine protein kinase
MTPPRRERVWALFDQAVELPPGERDAFLDAACAGDADLRTEVASLLAHDVGSPAGGDEKTFLKSPLLRSPEGPTLPHPADAPGDRPAPAWRIGHYRILGELGSGGMGTVYEAEQDNPRRAVALKVIRAGLASPGLVKRFAHEAQILGRLHHPGIAQIFEAGLTEEGQPYFAMELIHGTALDRYVHQHSLDVPARLGLFARVCDAVQHAHDKGVIHRDLKPGNILVEETGQPKVLDFGVARATDADLQTTTGRTEIGQLIGTLSYMSPEQIAADPALIDQRSDVYTLGVILFELLADRLPYHLAGLPLPEVARVIRDQDPSSLGSINTLLRGDVETIVAKALEKDRARRYPSAGELAADIRRHLSHEPIRARPASAAYRLRKFARRNKALVGGVAGVMAALVLGLIGTTLFAVREAEQRSQAEHNAQVAADEKRAAVYQTYRARLSAAAAALQNHDVLDAARQLGEAPEALRDWEWHHLHSRLDDRSGRITAPGESLWLLPEPGGLRVGRSVSKIGLRLTDLDGQQPRTIAFNADMAWLHDILQTKDGLRFVDAVTENALRLWDETGNLCLRGTLPVGLMRLSPDGSRLAGAVYRTGGAGFVLYETASEKQTALCIAHQGQLFALAFSPDGTRIVSAAEDGLACVWDGVTGEKVAECRGHTSKILYVAFRRDGNRLLTASADGSVRQWDPATGRQVEPPYERHSGEVLSAAYSPDGEWVASGGNDRTVRLWRASGGQEVAVLHGHTGAVYDVAFTPDGRRIASMSQKRAHGWTGDDTIGIWDVDLPATLPQLRGHTNYVYPVAHSPDGHWIASGAWDRTVRLWDARTGEACAVLDDGDIVKTLAFSPDGSRLVTARADWLQVWDVATCQRLKEFKATAPNIHAIEFHPDGATLATLDGSGGGAVFDTATGAVVARLRLGGTHDTKALAYSPDGRWLAGTSEDRKTVCLFDAKTYVPAAQFSGHEDQVCTVAFSPDSRRLASCGRDRTIRLWDIDGGACRVLRGHTDELFAVAFHPGGTRLASAGRDRAVWVWDLASGEAVVRLQGHTGYVWSLAFSPDGKTLVSGSGDMTVRLWDTEPLAKRYQARREAEALRPEAERLVKRLFAEKKDAAEVVAVLRADAAVSEPLRRAALRVVMRRGDE